MEIVLFKELEVLVFEPSEGVYGWLKASEAVPGKESSFPVLVEVEVLQFF